MVRFRPFFSFGFALLCSVLFVQTAFAASFTNTITTGTYSAHSVETEHFHMEFSAALKNGMDSDNDDFADILETTADLAEASWEQEITEMGYESPVNLEHGEKVLLFLDDTDEYLIPNSLGVSSVFDDGETIYMAIDPSLDDDVLNVTVAHEFFHVITFGYAVDFAQSYQDLSFAEAAAVWMEDQVFDDSNDYVAYLPYFFSEPDYSVFAGVLPADSLYEYGLNIWPRFLSEKFGTDIMKTVMENFFALDNDGMDNIYNVYTAMEQAVEAEGADFVEIFQEFRMWNYSLAEYEEGSLYPSVKVAVLHSDFPVSQTSIGSTNWPALFGTNYLQFSVGVEEGDFEFVLSKSVDVSFALTLLPISSDDTADLDAAVDAEFLMGTSGGSLVLPGADAYETVIAIVSPVAIDFDAVTRPQEVFDQGYQYFYSVEFGDFITSSDDDSTSDDTTDDSSTDTTNDATDSSNDLPTIEDLKIVNLTDSGVILGWDRVVDADVAGYRAYYGTESGNYDFFVDTTATRKTISDLTVDAIYYFAVKAVDAEGNESDDFSAEISTTVYDQLFSDVSLSSTYDTAIRYLVSIGVLQGYSDGTFLPDATVNRAELLKILIVAKGVTLDESLYANCFPDVTTEWFAQYVCYAAHNGWVEGYSDGFFKPQNTVNRAEALKMALEVFRFAVGDPPADTAFSDVNENDWFAPYVAVADGFGLLEESSVFGGAEGRTRAEIAEEVFRTLVVLAFDGEVFSDTLAVEFVES